MLPRIPRHYLAGLFGLFLLAAIGIAALVAVRNYRGMRRLLEAGPPSPMLASPQLIGIETLVPVSFLSADGLRIAAWYVPPVSGATVIVSHGAMGDRGTMVAEVRLLAESGFGVLAFDWPGLGESQGRVLWNQQARHALVAAIDWLAARSEVDAGRIGGLGFSMGGVVLTQVAADDVRIRALVIEAAAPDFRDFVRTNRGSLGALSEWAGRLALRGSGLLDPSFDTTNAIVRIAPRPVLIVGGADDEAVPVASLDKIYAAARDPKSRWIIGGAAHGNYDAADQAGYAQKLTEFFRLNLAAPAAPGVPESR